MPNVDITPDFGAVEVETGPATIDTIQALWFLAQNGTIEETRSIQTAKDIIEPRVLVRAPTASEDNLDLRGASIVHFNGASSVNFTGMLAPAPGKARVVIVHVSGAGTITMQHELTSTAANQLSLLTGAATAKATRGSAVFVYLASKWRQVV